MGGNYESIIYLNAGVKLLIVELNSFTENLYQKIKSGESEGQLLRGVSGLWSCMVMLGRSTKRMRYVLGKERRLSSFPQQLELLWILKEGLLERQ